MIEQDIFNRMKPDREALTGYGFIESGNALIYSEVFMNGDMRAEVAVSPDGRVSAKVIDCFSGEEYAPVRIEAHTGAYVGAVREEFSSLLQRIASSCFIKQPFAFGQSNRVARLIYEKYGESPDYPFGDDAGAGVFRYPGTRKWYGLIMNVKKCVLPGEDKTDREHSPEVEIMNLKARTDRIEELHTIDGIYPAYHMNRRYWISLLLDGRIDDSFIMELVGESRGFALSGSARKRENKNHQ